MTDALSLLEDGISELNKENTQEQQDPQPPSDEQQTKQLQLPENESKEIDELKDQTTLIDGDQNEESQPQDSIPKDLIPIARRDEISQEVDKLDGLTDVKNLKMKREWIVREKERLDEIEALKAQARKAEERRRLYLSLRYMHFRLSEHNI